MNPSHNPPALLQLAEQYVRDFPLQLVGKMTYQDQVIWIKRRPHSKATRLHQLQGVVARFFSLPIFYPTVTSGGSQSLFDEAHRLALFAEKNVPVPRVLALTDDFMVTADVGLQLHRHLQTLSDTNAIARILQQAVQCLNQLHRRGLCHGRPSLSDMTWQQGVIAFIDLEEDPLTVMSLPEAQARDIWLFLNSSARYCLHDSSLLTHLFHVYKEGINEETLKALQKMVKQLKPLRLIAEHVMKPILGRDGRTAVRANKSLEQYFDLAKQP